MKRRTPCKDAVGNYIAECESDHHAYPSRTTTMPWSRLLLALFFILAGILHFVFPAQYASVMPSWLPWHAELVAISGVCEIAGGLGVLWRRTRASAGIGLILLCIAVAGQCANAYQRNGRRQGRMDDCPALAAPAFAGFADLVGMACYV